MKAIKIDEKNRAAIEAALKEAQGQALVRVLTADMVFDYIETFEKKLDIPKVHMTGIVASVDLFADYDYAHASTYARTYNGYPQSTWFTVERRKTGWFLTAIERKDMCTTRRNYELTFPEEARKAIDKRTLEVVDEILKRGETHK